MFLIDITIIQDFELEVQRTKTKIWLVRIFWNLSYLKWFYVWLTRSILPKVGCVLCSSFTEELHTRPYMVLQKMYLVQSIFIGVQTHYLCERKIKNHYDRTCIKWKIKLVMCPLMNYTREKHTRLASVHVSVHPC